MVTQAIRRVSVGRVLLANARYFVKRQLECHIAKLGNQAAGAKRVIPLNVSAAFHTPLMAPAAERLRAALDSIEWRTPRIPVMANLTGRQHQGGDRISHVMEMQLRSPVLWAACVASLVEFGCDALVEVGPKRALTGMLRELAPGKAALAVGTPAAVQELAIPV